MPRKQEDKTQAERRNAVIYARFSSHRQREESIEQQVSECREYADKNNYVITNIYADHAKTGKTDRRAAFQRMMRDAERHEFSTVIAYKSNRMGRNMLQALSNEDKLAGYGIKVLYAKEEFGNTAAGRFALRTMMNVNQFYSENMAEDIKRGLMDNAAKCKVNNGSLPIGYRKGEDGRFAIDDKTAPIVREIFERVCNGDTYAIIARDLNNRGIVTRTGNKWGRSSFHAIISNEVYIGVYKYADVRIEGGVPSIIEKELFYKVQNKLMNGSGMKNARRNNSDYTLTGKLFCGHCGGAMVGVSGTSRSGELHYYYMCKNKRETKSCTKANVSRDKIEQEVVRCIKEYVLRDDVMDRIADICIQFQKQVCAENRKLPEHAELADVCKAINNIMAAIEQGIITPTTKNRLTELEEKKNELEIYICANTCKLPTYTKEQILFWLESFRHGDEGDKEYQRNLIKAFVKAVYLFDDKIRIVFSNDENNPVEHNLSPGVFAQAPLVSTIRVSDEHGAKIYCFGLLFVLECNLGQL